MRRSARTRRLRVPLPALVAGVLLVPAVYVTGAKLFDRRVGVIAAAVIAASPGFIWLSGEADTGANFEQAKAQRLSWLENAAIRERYLSQCGNGNADQAVEFCGLPMNHPTSVGPFVSQRFQRIASRRRTR